jgi:hypothetical protein
VGLGGVVVLVARRAAEGTRAARVSLAVLGAAWEILVGLLGAASLALWLFTQHVFTRNNENLLQFDPLALALAVLLPVVLVRRAGAGRPAARALRVAAYLVAALSVLGLALKALPTFTQHNAEIIALALPAHLAVAWAAWRVTAGAHTAAGRRTPREPGAPVRVPERAVG